MAGRVFAFIKAAAAIVVALALVSKAAEPNLLPFEKTLHPQSLDVTGIYALRQSDANLTGKGVNVAVVSRSFTYANNQPLNDYRPDAVHRCFKSTNFTFYDSNQFRAALCPHTTAMCSILFGSDANASNPSLGSFLYNGAVPKARADIYELGYFLNNIVLPGAPADEDVIVVGAGSPVEDWWTRGIESLAEKFGVVVVAPVGNGSDAFDPPLYPAASANCLGVGVVDTVNTNDTGRGLANFSLPFPEHSTAGPTKKPSCKPDIVAPGNSLVASMDDANKYEPSGSWTSFATPVVAGAVAMLIQEAKDDANLAAALLPSGSCLIKACLMNSAKKLPFWHKGRIEKNDDHIAPLDFLQGAGLLDAQAAFRQLTSGQQKGLVEETGWDVGKIDDGNTIQSYYIFVEDSNYKTISATVVWNRHYEDKYPFEPLPAKDADLRLELWAAEAENPDVFYLLDYSDSPNDNIEHIYFETNPAYRLYQIIVTYSNAQKPVNQEFALAWRVSQKPADDDIAWFDLNADGVVDDSDSTALVKNVLKNLISPGCLVYGDIDSNGVIDAKDFEILTKNYNRKAGWRNDDK